MTLYTIKSLTIIQFTEKLSRMFAQPQQAPAPFVPATPARPTPLAATTPVRGPASAAPPATASGTGAFQASPAAPSRMPAQVL